MKNFEDNEIAVNQQPGCNHERTNEPLTLALSRKGRGNARCVNQKQNNLFCFSEKIQFKKSLFGYFFSRKSNAFTLAEVLITLGIIGTVAALCIPTLVKEYKTRVVETRLKGFYSTMNQAVLRLDTDNGGRSGWYKDISYSDGQVEWVLDTFGKYLKIVDTKTNSYWTRYILADGSSFVLNNEQSRDFNYFPTSYENCLKGKTWKSISGRCSFMFYMDGTSKGLVTYGVNSVSMNNLYNSTPFGCNESANNPWFCTTIIQKNSWQIPKNYPFSVY